MNGYNPLRWDCEKSGCYNKVVRPKIEVFAECFPGKIAMTDVDGLVEIGGRFLFLEWKNEAFGRDIPTGQRILFERLTAHPGITAIVVAGNPETMILRRCQVFREGTCQGWRDIDLETFKRWLANWAHRKPSIVRAA